jgi:RimJ/RimL family protein N-acetyltransferase
MTTSPWPPFSVHSLDVGWEPRECLAGYRRAVETFTFRPLTRADLPDVLRWQSSAAAREWFSPKTLEQAETRYGARLDGTDRVRMFVALRDGRAIGYVQVYPTEPQPMPPGQQIEGPAVEIDYVIGEDDLVGHGIGPRMIEAFLTTSSDPCTPTPPMSSHAPATATAARFGPSRRPVSRPASGWMCPPSGASRRTPRLSASGRSAVATLAA